MSKSRGASGRRRDDDAELTQLQRQYRHADDHRKAFSDGSQAILKKQREQLEKLRAENALLKDELRAVSEPEKADSSGELEKLKAQLARRQDELESETQQLNDLESAVKEAEKELRDRRKQMGGVKGVEAQKQKISGQIRTLENRLDKSLKRYNDCLTQNSKLRANIDDLKQERKVFEAMRRKLEKELQDIKLKIAGVIDASRKAYEARDEAQYRLNTIAEKAIKEEQAFEVEIKDLKRHLEHDRKLKSFMGAKAQPRATEEALSSTRRLELQETPEQRMQRYEEALDSIRRVTGIDDLNQIVVKFLEVEDQNFSLFNLINELNNDIETAQEQINSLKQNITKMTEENASQAEERSKSLQHMEDKLKIVEEQKKRFEALRDETAGEVQGLCEKVQELFKKADCSQEEMTTLLGNAQVSEANVLQYLGAVERKVNDLLQIESYLVEREIERWDNKASELRDKYADDDSFDPVSVLGPRPIPHGLLGQGPGKDSSEVRVIPPSTGDEVDPLADDDVGHAREATTHIVAVAIAVLCLFAGWVSPHSFGVDPGTEKLCPIYSRSSQFQSGMYIERHARSCSR